MEIKGYKKVSEMRNQVKEELEHIPRGNINQNYFRQVYWGKRLHGLGKHSSRDYSKEEILVESCNFIRKENPDFIPEYDKKYFKISI